ncbi:hypothetical protein EDB83DRAFT_2325619 [Lactarius deliciosus]|nr:hypothetical protein EDB83DRAFT_2325619 [Lactarius deliciosus]
MVKNRTQPDFQTLLTTPTSSRDGTIAGAQSITTPSPVPWPPHPAATDDKASAQFLRYVFFLALPLFSRVLVATSTLQHASPWPRPPTIAMHNSAITATAFSMQEPPQRHPCRYDADNDSNQVDDDGEAEGDGGDDVEGSGSGDVEGDGGSDVEGDGSGNAAMGMTWRRERRSDMAAAAWWEWRRRWGS